MKGDIKSNVSYQHSFITFFFFFWRPPEELSHGLKNLFINTSSHVPAWLSELQVIWILTTFSLWLTQLVIMLNLTLIAYGSQAVLTTLLLINSLLVYQSFASLVSIFSCLSNILSAHSLHFLPFFFYPDIETVNPSSPLFQLLVIFISSGLLTFYPVLASYYYRLCLAIYIFNLIAGLQF